MNGSAEEVWMSANGDATLEPGSPRNWTLPASAERSVCIDITPAYDREPPGTEFCFHSANPELNIWAVLRGKAKKCGWERLTKIIVR